MAKSSEKSKLYKGVYRHMSSGRWLYWMACGSINARHFTIHSKTERGAALKYDKKMIENGKNPVNILKKHHAST